MRDIKGFVVWLGGVMFVTAVVVLMFYAAALVLPLLLVIFLVSVLANWGVSVYKRTRGRPEKRLIIKRASPIRRPGLLTRNMKSWTTRENAIPDYEKKGIGARCFAWPVCF